MLLQDIIRHIRLSIAIPMGPLQPLALLPLGYSMERSFTPDE